MAKKEKKVFTHGEENTENEKTVGETENTVSQEHNDKENDKTQELEKALEETKKELDAAKEAHIRTLAKYDNFRKRTQREKDAIYSESKANIITQLLPVIDNFDRAAMNSEADFDAYRKGVEMTFTSFTETLKKLGVEAFGEKGEQFNPNFHNAVMHCEDEELEENVITDVFSKGYKIGDKVLRPAMVKVAN